MKNSTAEVNAVAAAARRKNLPLSVLRLAVTYQARTITRDGMSVQQRAATILAVGLLQNLVVIDEGDGTYGVCAGGQRLASLEWLRDQGNIDADYPVPVLEIDKEHAHHASLIENIARQDMHTADLIGAYGRLQKERNMSAEAIAAAHGASLSSVKRLLALADVAPDLLELYRNDDKKMTFEALKALAGVSDHERQRAAWHASKSEYAGYVANSIRRLLSDSEMSGSSAIARYLTVETYEKAGGIVRRDLFADGDNGVFLADPVLADELAVAKMKRSRLVAKIAGEGWGWVEYKTQFPYEEERRYGQLSMVRREPIEKEAAKLRRLTAELSEARAKYDAFLDDDDADDAEDELYAKVEELEEAIEVLEAELKDYDPEQRKVAGVVVTLSHSGELTAKRGLIRSDDRAAAQALMQSTADQGDSLSLPPAKTRPVHSQALVERLQAQHAMAAQAELMARPRLAVAMFVIQMLDDVTAHISYLAPRQQPFSIHATSSHHALNAADRSLKDSAAAAKVVAAVKACTESLPTDVDKLLPHLLAMTDEALFAMLGVLLSLTVAAGNSSSHVGTLHKLIDLDMANYWTPTVDSYLGSVSKDQIGAVVTEALGEEAAAPLAKLKKLEAAKSAEELLAQARWLPESLRAPKASESSDE